MSGQQTSGVFSGGFMVGQFEKDSFCEGQNDDKSDTHGYDMVGNAQLNAVIEVISIESVASNTDDK